MDLRLRTREEQGKVVLVLPVFFYHPALFSVGNNFI